MDLRLYKKAVYFVLLCAGMVFAGAGRAFAFDRQTAASLSRYIMAGVYEKQGDVNRAIQEYKKALAANEKNAVIHLSLAAAYIKNNQLPEAIAEINRSSELEPDAVEPYAVLALLYFSQDKMAEAGKAYEKALKNAVKNEPKNIHIYKSLGILYLQQKQYKQAQEAFTVVVGLESKDYEAHFYLANILDEQKKRPDAIKQLQTVLELKPDYHPALNYLGYVYVEENRNLSEAEKMIKKALQLDTRNGAYVDSLGWLYFKQGRTQDAIRELERASSLLEDPVIFDHLGDAYFKMKNLEKAKQNWEKSLKLDPEQETVKKKLEKLPS
jgi:tetratricopeptide (TPR) repeat protein